MEAESGSNPNPAKGQPSSSSSPDTSKGAAPRPLVLLLAEDNLPDALLVREAIRKENLPLELHIASDGQQAIDFLINSERDPELPRPEMLALDLNLPKRDGFEVLRWLRASDRYREIPVLVVTSSDSPEDRSEAAKLGARYFRKPTSYNEYLLIGMALRQLMGDIEDRSSGASKA